MQFSSRSSIWLSLICASIATLSASPPVIGVARSRGAFMIDNASVPGNATILDGTSVTTMEQPSNVRLKTGQNLILGSTSTATIYQNRLLLQRGVAEVDRLSAYRVEAGKLLIGASSPDAGIRVSVDGGQQVQVAATGGSAEVRNLDGLLVARILPGTALQLQPAGNNTSADLRGRLTSESGKFFLTDETTKVKWEVQGKNLNELVGKRVHLVGSTMPPAQPGEPGIIEVASTTVLKGAAAAGAGGGATGAATAGGVSATTIALIAGGATAAILGGLAAAGTFSSSSSSR
jgi:hypothetical protein